MPPKQVTLTETEWQHIYELVENDTIGWKLLKENDFAPVFIQLNNGILKKFDDAPDYYDAKTPNPRPVPRTSVRQR